MGSTVLLTLYLLVGLSGGVGWKRRIEEEDQQATQSHTPSSSSNQPASSSHQPDDHDRPRGGLRQRLARAGVGEGEALPDVSGAFL